MSLTRLIPHFLGFTEQIRLEYFRRCHFVQVHDMKIYSFFLQKSQKETEMEEKLQSNGVTITKVKLEKMCGSMLCSTHTHTVPYKKKWSYDFKQVQRKMKREFKKKMENGTKFPISQEA